MAEATQIHFNARVRAMKSELFTAAELEEMLAQNDLQRMIDRLLDSPYRQELAEALTRFKGADAVEDAVSRNLVHAFQALIRRAQGDFKDRVALFLRRWDLMAVKSLLRAKHQRLEGDEAYLAVIPGPSMTVPLLHEFLTRDSMEALAGTLSAWNPDLCKVLVKALPAYRDSNDLTVLEEALDREYFEKHAPAPGEEVDPDAASLYAYLSMEIDRINLRTVLQHIALQGGGALDADRLLRNGTLSVSLLQEMAAASDLAGAVERLGTTPYRSLVEELFPLLQTHRISPVERFIEREIMHEIRRMSRRDVFGLGVVMDYVWLKFNEVVNLRLIARGLAGHLPAGRVREELNLT